MPLYRKFFSGPKVVNNMDHFMIEQSGTKSDINLVTYIGEKNSEGKYDPDMVFATKSFRKLNQRTPDNIFNLHFWYVEDPDVA